MSESPTVDTTASLSIPITRANDFKLVVVDASAAQAISPIAVDLMLLTNVSMLTAQNVQIMPLEDGHSGMVPTGIESEAGFVEPCRLRLNPESALDLASNLIQVMAQTGQLSKDLMLNRINDLTLFINQMPQGRQG